MIGATRESVTSEPPFQELKDFDPGSLTLPLGAHYLGHGQCSFHVWAPYCTQLSVLLQGESSREILLTRGDRGYFSRIADRVAPGDRYLLRLHENLRPDPASRFQPESVHGASQIVDPSFRWDDSHWSGVELSDYVIYETHVGAATREGTFAALVSKLPKLKQLGITAIELMPVAQFAGARNWGYDGVLPYAVQNTYGGPRELKQFVNAAHKHGLAVILDVVYNHLGPEGNYLREFGPYFTRNYKTPWGDAINFDGEHSDEVRRFFLENAFQWQTEFHLDGLRLDAVHAIRDFSAVPFLQELATVVHRQAQALGRPFHLLAESDLNDARLIRPEREGGYGMDAQWADDFHHCLHTLLTGERTGYYQDFGGVEQFARILSEGYAYIGQYSPFRNRRHGNSAAGVWSRRMVVCAQNHDQIGNRPRGDRLTALVDGEALKLAAAAVLLSPFTPLIFMGEEYGERAPFHYFVDYPDPTLRKAVREGRNNEFAFLPSEDLPDCFAIDTFQACLLAASGEARQPAAEALQRFYRALLTLRKCLRPMTTLGTAHLTSQVFASEEAIAVHYPGCGRAICVLLNFSKVAHCLCLDLQAGLWRVQLDSKHLHFGGPGTTFGKSVAATGCCTLEVQPLSVAVLERETGPASEPHT
jgi:maltooligosyltrehalose trehalohydrolase